MIEENFIQNGKKFQPIVLRTRKNLRILKMKILQLILSHPMVNANVAKNNLEEGLSFMKFIFLIASAICVYSSYAVVEINKGASHMSQSGLRETYGYDGERD